MNNRHLCRIGWSLALGAALTVVVSWGSALCRFSVPEPGDIYVAPSLNSWDSGITWEVIISRRIGASRFDSDWYPSDIPVNRDERWNQHVAAPPIPSWSALVRPRYGDRCGTAVLEEHGWPWLAFGGEACLPGHPFSSSTGEPITSWACLLDGGSVDRLDKMRMLPLRPLPLGLIADIATFAIASLSVMTLCSIARRRLRTRRGRCPNCGYALAGSRTCPECGQAPMGRFKIRF